MWSMRKIQTKIRLIYGKVWPDTTKIRRAEIWAGDRFDRNVDREVKIRLESRKIEITKLPRRKCLNKCHFYLPCSILIRFFDQTP